MEPTDEELEEPTPSRRMQLARDQLARVQVAAYDPIDWSDLSMYAFYSLENAVVAAADHLSLEWKRTHPSKVEVSEDLHAHHGLPDIAQLLTELNSLRKSSAYGETPPSHEWSAEDIAIEVEEYIEAVDGLVVGDSDD